MRELTRNNSCQARSGPTPPQEERFPCMYPFLVGISRLLFTHAIVQRALHAFIVIHSCQNIVVQSFSVLLCIDVSNCLSPLLRVVWRNWQLSNVNHLFFSCINYDVKVFQFSFNNNGRVSVLTVFWLIKLIKQQLYFRDSWMILQKRPQFDVERYAWLPDMQTNVSTSQVWIELFIIIVFFTSKCNVQHNWI